MNIRKKKLALGLAVLNRERSSVSHSGEMDYASDVVNRDGGAWVYVSTLPTFAGPLKEAADKVTMLLGFDGKGTIRSGHVVREMQFF